MLYISTWWWHAKYSPDYVRKLAAGIKRHLKQPYRFAVITDDVMGKGAAVADGKTVNEAWPIPESDHALLEVKGCFARLRMFDTTWQARHGIGRGDRLVCLDLDLIVTGELDGLFDRPEPFVILQGANTSNPCPYNGSVMMLRQGAYPGVWTDFTLAKAKATAFHEFPDDQGWIHHKIPGAAGWQCGPSGIYAFRKTNWATDALPDDAKIVAFPGYRDPAQFGHIGWIGQHWCI